MPVQVSASISWRRIRISRRKSRQSDKTIDCEPQTLGDCNRSIVPQLVGTNIKRSQGGIVPARAFTLHTERSSSGSSRATRQFPSTVVFTTAYRQTLTDGQTHDTRRRSEKGKTSFNALATVPQRIPNCNSANDPDLVASQLKLDDMGTYLTTRHRIGISQGQTDVSAWVTTTSTKRVQGDGIGRTSASASAEAIHSACWSVIPSLYQSNLELLVEKSAWHSALLFHPGISLRRTRWRSDFAIAYVEWGTGHSYSS